jgi:hypothetical protein
VTQEEPYLYTNASGAYQVFVPSVQKNSSGPSWASGSTPGKALSLKSFFIATPSSTVTQINAALALHFNLLFTPGVYHLSRSINVIWPNALVLGIFFQNENPYDVPGQSAWMASKTQDGYPAFYVSPAVRAFQGYGMGSYSFFDLGLPIDNAMAFQAPAAKNVQFHDLLTVFLNGSGGISSVINGTGAAVNAANGGPSDVVTYP